YHRAGTRRLSADPGTTFPLRADRALPIPSLRRLPMTLEPLAIGVCSWSLQVKSVAELKRLLERLGIDVVQIACGDPHHAAWEEGDRLPEVARTGGFRMT